MTSSHFFEIFLLIDFFAMGVLTSLAVRHAKAHFKSQEHDAEKLHLGATTNPLPPAVKEHLLKTSEDQFEAMFTHTVSQLQHDLNDTSQQINTLIKRLATEVVSNELEHYRTDLAKLHEEAEKDFGVVKQEMDGHQAEMKARVAQELEAEKQRLIKQIDTKLSDAVGSFLLETLQHNIDLGSQADYLIGVLEEHKADFIKEVSDEAQTPR